MGISTSLTFSAITGVGIDKVVTGSTVLARFAATVVDDNVAKLASVAGSAHTVKVTRHADTGGAIQTIGTVSTPIHD